MIRKYITYIFYKSQNSRITENTLVSGSSTFFLMWILDIERVENFTFRYDFEYWPLEITSWSNLENKSFSIFPWAYDDELGSIFGYLSMTWGSFVKRSEWTGCQSKIANNFAALSNWVISWFKRFSKMLMVHPESENFSKLMICV